MRACRAEGTHQQGIINVADLNGDDHVRRLGLLLLRRQTGRLNVAGSAILSGDLARNCGNKLIPTNGEASRFAAVPMPSRERARKRQQVHKRIDAAELSRSFRDDAQITHSLASPAPARPPGRNTQDAAGQGTKGARVRLALRLQQGRAGEKFRQIPRGAALAPVSEAIPAREIHRGYFRRSSTKATTSRTSPSPNRFSMFHRRSTTTAFSF